MKKIMLLFMCCVCSICSFSQGELGLTFGLSKDAKRAPNVFSTSNVVFAGQGFNLVLNYEDLFSKRFGYDLGVEYSRAKVFSDDYYKTIAPSFPDFDNFSKRLGAKVGFFYAPIQRNKWTWKIAVLSNFYYDLQGIGIGNLGSNQLDEFNYGVTFMNKIKYEIKENVLIIATQSYDFYEELSGDSNRTNFNFGVGYKF